MPTLIILIVGKCLCDNQDSTREMQKSIVSITLAYERYLSAIEVSASFLKKEGRRLSHGLKAPSISNCLTLVSRQLFRRLLLNNKQEVQTPSKLIINS